jgi:hypothetical protein
MRALRSWLPAALVILGGLSLVSLAQADSEEPQRHVTTTTISCDSPIRVGEISNCTISVRDTSPLAIAVTPLGEVNMSTTLTGAFSAPCELAEVSRGLSRCSVSYTPAVRGFHSITAFFPGDEVFSGLKPSEDTTTIVAVEPHPTRTEINCQPEKLAPGQRSTCSVLVEDIGLEHAVPEGLVDLETDGDGRFEAGDQETTTCSLEPGEGFSAGCVVSYVPRATGDGSHGLTASYRGELLHLESAGTTSLRVLTKEEEEEEARSPTVTTVSCEPSSLAVGRTSLCTITVEDTSPRPIAPTGSVDFVIDGEGELRGGSCVLPAANGPRVSCQRAYTPTAVGSGKHKITALYRRDASHRVSQGETTLNVGTVRFAAPGGRGADPCADPTRPCSLFTAADVSSPGTTLNAGDEVILAPGEYRSSAGDLGPQGFVSLEEAIDLHGESNQPRPLIDVDQQIPGMTAGLFLQLDDTVSHIEVRSALAPTVISTAGVVDDVIARSSAADAVACAQPEGIIRDSACLSTGLNAAAIASDISVSGSQTVRLRNVTAVSTGVGSAGMRYAARNGFFLTIDAKSVIADGATDVVARGIGGNVEIDLDHSDYVNTVEDVDAGGGTAIVTPAGSDTNIVAVPKLAADHIHQLVDSPTLDAGATDELSDPFDIDGQVRDGTPDIGADEFVPNPTATSLSCEPEEVLVNGVATCTVTVEDTSDEPSTPTGTVEWRVLNGDEGEFAPKESCNLNAVGDDKHASCSLSYRPTAVGSGAHEIFAAYEGDRGHEIGQDADSIGVTANNDQGATATRLECAPAPVETAHPTTCTATVTGLGPIPSAPAGAVSFSTTDPGDFSPQSCNLEHPEENRSSCQVTYTPTSATPALHILTASYEGNKSPSHDTLNLRVITPGGGDQAGSTTALECAPDAIETGHPTSCTVTVTGLAPNPSAPTGEVAFSSTGSGDFAPQSCELENPVANASSCQVTYTPTSATPALHVLAAVYKGTTEHVPSEDTFDLHVNAAAGGGGGGDEHTTATTVTCQPPTVIVGGGAVCTAEVEDTAAEERSAPSGSVDFETSGNGSFSNPCTLSPTGQAKASCQLVYEPEDAAGSPHEILAKYEGDDDHAESHDSSRVAVAGPNGGHDTAVELDCEPAIVIRGGISVCTVTVKDLEPAQANRTIPTGSVFLASDGAGAFSTGSCLLFAIRPGEARCQVVYKPSSLDPGGEEVHEITAGYAGDPGHEPSLNTDLVTVQRPNGGHRTTTTLDCKPTNLAVGEATRCTATVTDNDANPGNPTRAVVFASDSAGSFDAGGCQLQPLPGNRASCAFTYHPLEVRSGAHRIFAAYVGDNGHEPSPVATDTVTVRAAAPGPSPNPKPSSGPKTPKNPTTAAPNTILKKKPRRKTALRKARFKFVSDQPGSGFQCKLDRKPFKPCRSPFKRKVKPGRHTFKVRAVNAQGVADPTPAVFRWKVGRG